MEVDEQGAKEIACRSRGTPRIANRLLKRIRDYGEIQGQKCIDKALADYSLKELGVNEQGLNLMDQEILRLMEGELFRRPCGYRDSIRHFK